MQEAPLWELHPLFTSPTPLGHTAIHVPYQSTPCDAVEEPEEEPEPGVGPGEPGGGGGLEEPGPGGGPGGDGFTYTEIAGNLCVPTHLDCE